MLKTVSVLLALCYIITISSCAMGIIFFTIVLNYLSSATSYIPMFIQQLVLYHIVKLEFFYSQLHILVISTINLNPNQIQKPMINLPFVKFKFQITSWMA